MELTVQWEILVDEAYERKKLKYIEFATEAKLRGLDDILPNEIGCKCFMASSTIKILKKIGVRYQTLKNTIQSLQRVREQSNNWL